MIAKTLEKELNLEPWQVNKVIKLIDDGNTIPFIARYRKDVTGSLNDELLRKFDERLKYLRNLEDKKTKIKFNLSDVLMPDEKYNIFDIWAKKELGKFKNSFTAEVEPHSAVLIKIYN